MDCRQVGQNNIRPVGLVHNTPEIRSGTLHHSQVPDHKNTHIQIISEAPQHALSDPSPARNGAIELVPEVKQGTTVYSHLFAISKRSGCTRRAVLALKWLNLWMQKRKFKMESLHSFLLAIRRHDWMVSLDLQETYLHLPHLPRPSALPQVLFSLFYYVN